MRVILEGFDGTGKSTLAKKIQEKLACRIEHHRGRPTDQDHFLMRLRSCHYARWANEAVVFDRFPAISENIYRDCGGFVFENILWEIQRCKIDAIIHCTGSALTIKPQSDRSERDRDDTQRLLREASEYLMVYDILMSDLQNYVPIIRYDRTEEGDTDRVLNYLTSHVIPAISR